MFPKNQNKLFHFLTEFPRQKGNGKGGNGYLPSPLGSAGIPYDGDDDDDTAVVGVVGTAEECARVPEVENGRMVCNSLPGGGKKCTPGIKTINKYWYLTEAFL